MHLLDEVPDITDTLFDHFHQKWSKSEQACVISCIDPSLDEDSVVWLQLEVLSNIINYDSFAQVRPNS